ncbi:hypothetical protein [Paenibacillus sp. HB172176]|uniref:hypothetical protein n=1 Tax=Paenibacillus sp. HB172176 TaxID=2493690 RepID=UPI001438D03A|nr:hypothetical protein [Paenibacillus sp. HB172176]
MESSALRNMSITGIGSSNGGSFSQASIDGICKITGDLECEKFSMKGKVDVRGSLQSKRMDMNGILHVEGALSGDRIQMNGKLEVDRIMTGETILMNGELKIHGNCEAESLEARGNLKLQELNAERIKLSLQGSCNMDAIGGESIRIRRSEVTDKGKWLRIFGIPAGGELSVKEVEGDVIDLEYTKADIVRGGEVRIGPGCKIGLVEYKSKLDVDKRAKVEQSVQL